MSSSSKNVLVVELNEFNVNLLSEAVKQHSLPSIAKMLSLPHTQYKTHDRYNSGYLEPWVQWVSVHAGKPATEHRIKHLGDVPDLGFEQCWETLDKADITTGVWGVMNGARREAKNSLFFLPDPWTFSEKAYPEKLNALLDLPRYLSKNYQQLSKLKIAQHAWKLIKFILLSQKRSSIIKRTGKLIRDLLELEKKHYLYISYFDYISTQMFIQYKNTYRPRCSFLFLNSLAHLQHHHWSDGESIATPEILYGLKTIDNILFDLFRAFPDDAIVVHNGLSQMNTNHEKPWVLYRQKDPLSFLKALKLPVTKVEQHMTHDAHVFFDNATDCLKSIEKLKHARIQGRVLFHVEANPHDPCKLFYQLRFTDALDENTNVSFTFDGQEYAFFHYFDRIVRRTGRHIPIGSVFSDTIPFENHMFNHEFNQHLFHYLKPDSFTLPETTSSFNLSHSLPELSDL